jgi:hypothetical protein
MTRSGFYILVTNFGSDFWYDTNRRGFHPKSSSKLVHIGKEKIMKLAKQAIMNTFVIVISLTVILPPVEAAEKQWVVFHDNLPQDIQRIPIKLEFTHSSTPFYDSSQHMIKSEKLEKDKDGYQQQLDLGKGVDGNQYIVMLRDASDMNVISQNPERLCMAKVLRMKENNEPETVKEGLLSMNSELVIPLEAPPVKLGVPFREPIKGVLRIGVYINNYPVYDGRCQTTLNGTLSGSASTEKAFLHASLSCGDSLELKNRILNLTVKPFSDRMDSAACIGKVSEPLTLRAAKFVVEKIASDSSELVLALLDGNLVQEKRQDELLPAVGKPFPAFARVDLVKRELVALDNLRKEAGDEGYIVLIFGDFKMTMPPYYGGQPPMRNLSLDETMISDVLKKDCEKSVVISFVCQQLSLSYLYEKWLGRDPEFHVLSDFSNLWICNSSAPEWNPACSVRWKEGRPFEET